MSVIEDECEITEQRFLELKEKQSPLSHPVLKRRHTFSYGGGVIEIDVYPNWKKTAILETELTDRSKRIELPDFIRVVKEVTGEKAYSNAAMSMQFPTELL
jgi:CYTH domain-containing protein